MNLREDDTVSAVALVMEESTDTAAQVEATVDEPEPPSGDGAGPADG
jgi:hypothetical protein